MRILRKTNLKDEKIEKIFGVLGLLYYLCTAKQTRCLDNVESPTLERAEASFALYSLKRCLG